MTRAAALRLVLDAADRQYRELLNQAGNYEKLGQKKVVDEYLREHIRPLQEARAVVERLIPEVSDAA